ncbi:hypothetical protein NM688_g8088 [Phlebia brevispora]|uniref:Uncharacterized protein n=1 Tax=Phlebia brevispora TaxID=194682 RepID=A0ACC1RXF8_9APHY|nr:hypothetical protein NM688_g8088 [Phlebia brevispora]
MGFVRIKSDPSLYVFRRGNVRIIIPVYINDMRLASTFKKESDDVVQELATHFELHDLGETSYLLGIEITGDHPNRTISLSQCQYIIDTLERFGFSGCSPVYTC